ncbi:MAG TPA: SDR family NAD(P)-dependent oxidoreductase, partial [Patescibacteria group bacterium]
MTILVTGGAGYIGSHAVKALKAAGHTVIIFDSLENGHEYVLDTLHCRDTFVKGDIRNLEDLEKAFSQYPVDAVMHFAAYALVGESVKEPEKYLRNNTLGTINLLYAMAKANVHKLIFSSTCAVYGEPQEVPIHEGIPLNPVNP